MLNVLVQLDHTFCDDSSIRKERDYVIELISERQVFIKQIEGDINMRCGCNRLNSNATRNFFC